MKITSLLLSPFAGFREKEVRFEGGLNVVLGPNDKGKSTLFRAIEAALFLPTKISRSTKEGRDLLPRVIPLQGDHARVVLLGESSKGSFRLQKVWGQNSAATFESSGANLSQEDKVEEALRSHLPVPAATFQHVLFMGQGTLHGTVEALEEKRESLHSLGDLLRVAVDQTAGVSVERLKSKLAEKIAESLEHWDILSNQPEQGKGIENPWKKGIGSVLAAYYSKEEARRDWKNAHELESRRDLKNASLSAKQLRREECREFLIANKKFIESSSQRQALEGQLLSLRSECEGMAKDFDTGTRADVLRETNAPEVARLEAAAGKLQEELRGALAFSKRKEAVGRVTKARNAQASLESAKKALAQTPALRPEDLKRLRSASQEVDSLRASLKGGKIVLQLQVKKDLEVSVKKDLDVERRGVMTPAKPMVLNAGGRIQLASELFELTVTSGEGQLAQVEEAFARKSEGLEKILSELGVKTLEEAQDRLDRYGEALSAVKSAEALLASVLAPGEKIAELEALAEGAVASSREPELVSAELQSLQKDLGGKKELLIRAEGQLKDLERRHGTSRSSDLMEKLMSNKALLTEASKKLEALPAAPEVSDVGAFVKKYEALQAESATLTDELQALQVELAELKARMSDQSAEELGKISTDAELAYKSEISHAKALLRVKAAVEAVEGKSEDVYSGFRGAVEKQIASLSLGKYGKSEMKEALPSAFQRSDGAVVPYDWLSSGTKDAFAVALRLAMAKKFLGPENGFLMLDDPLVNLDPERQQLVAGMLQEFAAQGRQLIVFTCHPSHAELFGGHRISL